MYSVLKKLHLFSEKWIGFIANSKKKEKKPSKYLLSIYGMHRTFIRLLQVLAHLNQLSSG